MRHLMRMMAVVAVALLLTTACGSDDDVQPEPDDSAAPDGDTDNDNGAAGPLMASLLGEWALSALTVGGEKVAIPSGANTEMQIEDGLITGTGGCNGFGGDLEIVDESTLRIGNLSWTEMGCDPFAINEFEEIYLTALSSVTGWSADPDGVTFTSDNAEIRYVPGEPAVHQPLEGTRWVLDTIFSGGDGPERAATSTDQSASEASIVFSDGQVTVSATDCEDLAFDYNYEEGRDGNLRMPSDADLDAVDCAGDDRNFVAALEGLVNATGFMIDENRLTLIGEPGELVGFRAA